MSFVVPNATPVSPSPIFSFYLLSATFSAIKGHFFDWSASNGAQENKLMVSAINANVAGVLIFSFIIFLLSLNRCFSWACSLSPYPFISDSR